MRYAGEVVVINKNPAHANNVELWTEEDEYEMVFDNGSGSHLGRVTFAIFVHWNDESRDSTPTPKSYPPNTHSLSGRFSKVQALLAGTPVRGAAALQPPGRAREVLHPRDAGLLRRRPSHLGRLLRRVERRGRHPRGRTKGAACQGFLAPAKGKRLLGWQNVLNQPPGLEYIYIYIYVYLVAQPWLCVKV